MISRQLTFSTTLDLTSYYLLCKDLPYIAAVTFSQPHSTNTLATRSRIGEECKVVKFHARVIDSLSRHSVQNTLYTVSCQVSNPYIFLSPSVSR